MRLCCWVVIVRGFWRQAVHTCSGVEGSKIFRSLSLWRKRHRFSPKRLEALTQWHGLPNQTTLTLKMWIFSCCIILKSIYLLHIIKFFRKAEFSFVYFCRRHSQANVHFIIQRYLLHNTKTVRWVTDIKSNGYVSKLLMHKLLTLFFGCIVVQFLRLYNFIISDERSLLFQKDSQFSPSHAADIILSKLVTSVLHKKNSLDSSRGTIKLS